MTNKTGLPSKIWLYTKFQLITKSVPALIVFPIYTMLLDALMRSSGKENISSGDYVEFLFSYQGVLMLIITGILLSILVSLDINTCIIGSALIKENKMRASSRLVFVHGIKTARLFLRPSGLFILLYVATVIPLVGIGLTISATKDFQIPNFITDVIFNNTLYTTLYIIAMAVLTLLSLRYIFTFHYIILFKKNTWEALKSARQFMKRHQKKF
ncbi:MAG: glycerophosphoryl diester phosphodiesterase membrane domain-containing protein, partial [Bacillota bacterium]|nr:glycerophosphoryl diester phosphodiesterase membrane domain-containing protein [Bacillota bacterium]